MRMIDSIDNVTRALLLPIVLLICTAAGSSSPAWAKARRSIPLPRPTASQLAWQNASLGMFFHYDLQVAYPHKNITDLVKEAEKSPWLEPVKLDTDQWLAVAHSMGAKYAVYVAKHASGYLFFQSKAYPFGLRQSTWLAGRGDVVKMFIASCAKFGIKPGLYCTLSTNNYLQVQRGLVRKGHGGNVNAQIRYAHTCEQIEAELWGNYGPLFYCWFDGGVLPANRGGPNLVPLLKRLQPDMVCFQGPFGAPGGLTRWIGNERGIARYPCWSTVADNSKQFAGSAPFAGSGDANGTLWDPAEVDISVLQGDHWFWRPHAVNKLLTLHHLVQIYYDSVGRGCNLIVNAPINEHGVVPATVARRLAQFGAEIHRRFKHPIAETAGRGATIELKLSRAQAINNVMIMENIRDGQRIRRYEVDGLKGGKWGVLCHGESIGHERLQQFQTTVVSAVKLVVLDSIGKPEVRRLAIFDIGTR